MKAELDALVRSFLLSEIGPVELAQRAASIGARAEREECAKLCEAQATCKCGRPDCQEDGYAMHFAELVRARSQDPESRHLSERLQGEVGSDREAVADGGSQAPKEIEARHENVCREIKNRTISDYAIAIPAHKDRAFLLGEVKRLTAERDKAAEALKQVWEDWEISTETWRDSSAGPSTVAGDRDYRALLEIHPEETIELVANALGKKFEPIGEDHENA